MSTLTRLILPLTCLCGGIFVALAHGAENAEDQPPAMQGITSGEEQPLESHGPEAGTKEPKEYGALEYRLIGPAVGGRMGRHVCR